MPQYDFGSGSLWGTPLTTVNGVAVTNPSPVRFGILQDVSMDFDAPSKALHGTFNFPVAIGRGKGKLAFKAKFGRLQASMFSSLFFGHAGQPVTGQTLVVEGEIGIIPGTPFAVTVAQSATWTRDLGVYYAATGLKLNRVASAPITGQYSVAAGVYTFAAADTTLGVLIDYQYTLTTGYNITMYNELMGNQPTFRALFRGLYNGNQAVFEFNNCISEKISFASKIDDFMIPEMDFQAFSDASNIIGTMNYVEQ
jgi:hypothetical protein